MTSKAYTARDPLPDMLRGFALLGIVLVNVSFFSHSSSEGIYGDDIAGAANTWATLIMVTLFQGKFYLLFSFLFGYSSHYITRGEKSGRGRFAVRSLLLMALGVVHFTLLWHGDILFLYGLFGLILLAFMFRTERTLRVWAWVLWGFSALLLSALSFLTWLAETTNVELGEIPSQLDTVMRTGTFGEAIMPRLELWVAGASGGLLLQGGLVFAAFLVGVLAARKGLLGARSSELRPGRLMVWGFGVGLPLQAVAAVVYVSNELSPEATETAYLVSLTLGFMTAPLLSMGYIGLVAKLVSRGSALVSWLRYPGKASLTNYVLQSAVLSAVFGPWGLGLFQEVDYWVALLIGLSTFIALSAVSALWFQKFTQGPMEKLVTTATRRVGRRT